MQNEKRKTAVKNSKDVFNFKLLFYILRFTFYVSPFKPYA